MTNQKPYRIRTLNGTQKGSRAALQSAIDKKLREMKLHSGQDEFDPLVLMAIIACEAYDTKQLELALVASSKLAEYLRPKIAPQPDPEPPAPAAYEFDIVEKRNQLAQLLGVTYEDVMGDEAEVIEPYPE